MLGKRSNFLSVVSAFSAVILSVDKRRRFVGLASSDAPLGAAVAVVAVAAAAAFCFCCCSSKRCLSAFARFLASFSRLRWAMAASSSGSAAAHLDVDDIVNSKAFQDCVDGVGVVVVV